MKYKKKTIFLPIILIGGLLLGACNNTPTPEPPAPVVTTFTVSFDANGGTGSMSSVEVNEGEYTLPSCTLTAPEGKKFAGWKVSGQDELLQPGAKIDVSSATTLVAQWALVKYVVSFDANGGEGTMANVSDILGEYTLPESTFTAPAGHSFGGWKLNGQGDVLQPGAKITVSGNVSLVAQWTANIYTVTFKNGDVVLATAQVAYGTKAKYEGETPTKEVDGDFYAYRFRGWDHDINSPITGDTVFSAKFGKYDEKIEVEDFESYQETADLIENGWVSLGYNNTTQKWTEETNAAVSISKNAGDGKQALKFSAWENGVGYKFKKAFAPGAFVNHNAVNAINFKLQVPSINTVKILLYANAPIFNPDTGDFETKEAQFNFTYKPTTDAYVEYTIPLADDNWLAWGNAQYGTMKSIAEGAGMSEDDFYKIITKIEFYIEGNDGNNGQPYVAFFDSLKFVTMDKPERKEVEKMNQYNRYTGKTISGNTIELTLGAEGAATAKVLDAQVPDIAGKISLKDKEVTFTSNDEGATLVYKGTLTNGGHNIKGVSVDGSLKETVGVMDLASIQVVDNFDQYTSEGKTWYITVDKTDPANPVVTEHLERSGMRGAYYAEYYAGERSAEFGGPNWSLMQNGDQMKLKTDGGHSGQNYMCLKSSAYNAMRYVQFSLIDGTSELNSFRGSKLGFWVKTNGRVPHFKVSMYSQTMPRNATKDNSVRHLEVEPTEAINEWTHYEVELNPNLTYYGFLIMMQNHYSYGSCPDAFLYIDDIEVYDVSPYVTQK